MPTRRATGCTSSCASTSSRAPVGRARRRASSPTHGTRASRSSSGSPFPTTGSAFSRTPHWSDGCFGYFPTYLLGTVLSVQIWEKARAAIPNVDEQIERGDFQELHLWLRENIYALGRKFTPAETIERVVGGPIDPQPYLRYLRDKLETPAP